MRGTRHCASRYIDPLPFQLIGGFPRGAFDDQPSATVHTATVAPSLSASLSFPNRRLRHGPRTDVTDSTSVKKANTKPISAPSTTSARCIHDHCPFPTLILTVDSGNKRPPSLYPLGLCRAHVVLLLRLPYVTRTVHQSSFPICPCKDRFVKPERKTARYLQANAEGGWEG